MSERERLSEVYDHYRRDEGTQSRWSSTNPGNRAIVDERSRATERLLRQHWHTPSGRSCTLLDVGCGRYSLLAPTLDRSQQGVLDRLGVDLLLERVVDAERTSRFDALACADGTQLPIRDESVDLVALVTVLSSVLDDAIADAIAADVSRVLRPGGAVVWYDFRYRNPANSNTRPMVPS